MLHAVAARAAGARHPARPGGDETGAQESPAAAAIHVICADVAQRRALAELIGERLCVPVQLWRSADAFLDISASIDMAVLLVDQDLPGTTGLELLHRIEGDLRFAAVMIAGAQDVRLAVEIMRAGAVNLIEKPCDPAAVIESIETARAHLATAAPVLAARRQIAGLSGRERDVLHGLFAGLANKTMARTLGISPRTIECYRATLMSKLGVTSLAEALQIALTAGIALEAPAPDPAD
jgi:two-component system response regulator FixJ